MGHGKSKKRNRKKRNRKKKSNNLLLIGGAVVLGVAGLFLLNRNKDKKTTPVKTEPNVTYIKISNGSRVSLKSSLYATWDLYELEVIKSDDTLYFPKATDI